MSYQQAPDGYGLVPTSSRTPRDPSKGSRTTFLQGLRSQILATAIVAVLATIIVGLGARGLIEDRQFNVIDDGAMIGSCTWVAFTLLWPYFGFDYDKEDLGVPDRAAVPLLVLIGPLVGFAATLSMSAWPLLLGDTAVPGTVTGNLWGQPLGLVLMGGATWVLTNVGVTFCTLVFVPFRRLWLRGVSVLPSLIGLFLGGWWYLGIQNAPFRMSTLLTVTVLIPVTTVGPVLVGLLLTHVRQRQGPGLAL